jgi:hypothetical protein
MNQDDENGWALILTIQAIFILLKLISVISWSWWWVLSPLWIPFLLGGISYALQKKTSSNVCKG